MAWRGVGGEALGDLWRPLGGLLGAFWRSRGPPFGEGLEISARVGPLGLWEPTWALWGPLGAVLGTSWADLGRSWGPLGPSWAVGGLKRRQRKNLSKTYAKSINFGLRGPFWSCLGPFWSYL